MPFHRLKSVSLLTAVAVALAGCETTPSRATASAITQSDNVGSVLAQPFYDLNLMRAEISPVLKQTALHPYAAPKAADCAALDTEVAELDGLLGPDVDTPPSKTRRSPIGGQDGWGLAREAVGGFVPLRGVVRHVSGAELKNRALHEAVSAGFARRGYLKGLRAQYDCAATGVANVGKGN